MENNKKYCFLPEHSKIEQYYFVLDVSNSCVINVKNNIQKDVKIIQ